MAARRMRPHEVANLRRSFAATHQLSDDQALQLFAELAALLAERQHVAQVLDELRAPVAELRRLLTELHGLVHAPGAR